jgi:hypothetical protein
MEVVNVCCKNIRPEYDNLYDWCQDCNNVYIGRKGIVFITMKDGKRRYPDCNSLWHNPFKITKDVDRNKCLEQYREYIIEKIENEHLYKELLMLKNKILGCWCAPEPCHGNVLQDLINYYSK